MKLPYHASVLLAGAALFGATQAVLGALFPQAPPVGASNGAGVLITQTGVNTYTFQYDPNSGNPYDTFDDFTIAFVNNSNALANSIVLNGNNIFGFDGDGQSTFTGWPSGVTGYEGYNAAGGYVTTSFTYNPANPNTGTVNFLHGGVPVGGNTWWSMEGPASSAMPSHYAMYENGSGYNTTGQLQTDPTGGINGQVLVFPVPAAAQQGTVVLLEAAGGTSDIIRFTGNGLAIFYSDVDDGAETGDLADTGLPGNNWPGGIVLLNEILDPHGSQFGDYVPGSSDPGFFVDSNGYAATYTFYSEVPEPSSLALLAVGSTLALRRWRRKA